MGFLRWTGGFSWLMVRAMKKRDQLTKVLYLSQRRAQAAEGRLREAVAAQKAAEADHASAITRKGEAEIYQANTRTKNITTLLAKPMAMGQVGRIRLHYSIAAEHVQAAGHTVMQKAAEAEKKTAESAQRRTEQLALERRSQKITQLIEKTKT